MQYINIHVLDNFIACWFIEWIVDFVIRLQNILYVQLEDIVREVLVVECHKLQGNVLNATPNLLRTCLEQSVTS